MFTASNTYKDIKELTCFIKFDFFFLFFLSTTKKFEKTKQNNIKLCETSNKKFQVQNSQQSKNKKIKNKI